MSAHEEQKAKAHKRLLELVGRNPGLAGLMCTGRMPGGEYETVQEIERHPTCIITNCRRKLVKGEALCRKHLGRERS